MALSFIFDTGKGETPQSVARKRALAAAIMSGMGPRTARNANEGIGNALASIGQGIQSNVLNRRANAAETAGQDSASSALSSLFFPSAPAPAPAPALAPSTSASDYADARVGSAHGDSAETIMKGLMDRGMPEHIARGFVMNFRDESNLNPGINEQNPIVPGSRGGFGLAQWTGPRRKALEAYAAERGVPASDLDTQLDFLMTELQGPESSAWEAIQASADPGSAAAAIVNNFLRPAEEHRARREARYRSSGGSTPPAVDAVNALAGGGDTIALPEIAVNATAPNPYASVGVTDDQFAGMQAGTPAPPMPMSGQQPAPPMENSRNVGPSVPGGGAPKANASTLGLPETAAQGTVMRGKDGQVYQYAQLNGADDGSGRGDWGWIRANPSVVGAPVNASGGMDPSRPETIPPMAGGSMGASSMGSGPSLQQLAQAASNPWLNDQQRAIINQMLEQKLQQNDPAHQLDMEYRRAQIDKMRREAATGGNEVYGTPIYGRDAEGNMVLGAIGKDGTFKRLDTGGVDVTPGVTWQDFGTYRQAFDNKSGQAIGGPVRKENYQEAFDTGAGSAAGKAQAEAAATLPTDLATAEQAVSELDELIAHPGLSQIAGPLDQYRPSWTMGAEGRDALARFNQARGRAFLQAFGMLKGGGQITEIEGMKAEQAMARMDRAQSEAEFKQALTDFRDAVKAGMDKLRQRAGQSSGASTPTDYKSKYGLD